MVDDIRVILVKLADRVHNMRTLHHLPEERRVKIAQETLDIYAPIANRLGMSKVKNELEELSFQYWSPSTYESLRARVEARRKTTEATLEELKRTLATKLEEAQVPIVRIEGRTKRLYSIAQKLKKQKIELEQVYDFAAVRVLTTSVRDCYAVLGIIHNLWSPIPGRIKDFIAMARPNGYQSLHTSVISDQGTPFEVQIRTLEMHNQAEEGIAAHWKYKEGRVGDQRDERYFQWMRQLLEWQQEVRDAQEFIQDLKLDLYPEEVYTFTPKVKSRRSPRGHARRLRVCHPHGCRPPLRQCPREREDGAAPLPSEERRHRRDHHAGDAHAQPRLAEFRGYCARPEQNPAFRAGGGEGPQHRAGTTHLREGGTSVRPEHEDAARERGDGEGRRGVRRRTNRGTPRLDRLWQARRTPGAQQARAAGSTAGTASRREGRLGWSGGCSAAVRIASR